MGVSTDAILLYGIPLEEGAFDEYVESDNEDDSRDTGPAWMAWSGKDEDGVTLIRHCSDSCPMYFVAIPESETRAWRGHPKRIAEVLPFGSGWDDTLRAYIEKHKLKTDGGPGWWLASDWG